VSVSNCVTVIVSMFCRQSNFFRRRFRGSSSSNCDKWTTCRSHGRLRVGEHCIVILFISSSSRRCSFPDCFPSALSFYVVVSGQQPISSDQQRGQNPSPAVPEKSDKSRKVAGRDLLRMRQTFSENFQLETTYG